jgi:phosphoserine aminotransferase
MRLLGVLETVNAPNEALSHVGTSPPRTIEMAMWSLVGARGVDMLAWQSFGDRWVAVSSANC